MKNTPTLEEIKEYFKNAELIKDRGTDKITKIYWDKVYLSGYNNWYMPCGNFNGVYLWSKGKYADIISYKLKSYEITSENITKLAKQSSWSKKFLQELYPDAFENELEVGKWYIHKKGSCLTFIEKLKSNDFIGYGFGYNSKWIESKDNWTYGFDGWELATEEEVKQALIKEAEKRGFKIGTRFKIKNNDGDYTYGVCDGNINYIQNWVDDIPALGFGINCIFRGDTGWAEIIEETKVTQQELIDFYKKANGIDNLKVI